MNPRKKLIGFLDLRRLKPKTIFFLSSTIIFISYIKPIFSVWAYSDEYDFFEVIPKLGKHLARDGNLICSLLYDNFSTHLVNSPDDLWRLRVLSFLCLILILNQVSNQILTHNQSRSIQFLLPIALTLPAPMTFISWALIWHGSLAMLIAYIANILWLKGKFRFGVLSVVLLCFSLLMSPVAAFSIFGFHAIIFVLARAKTNYYLRVTTNLIILYGISGFLSVATIFISKNLNGLELNGRVGPPKVSDLPEKMYWIISRPIVVSMRFFDISSPSPVNGLVTTLFVTAILISGFTLQSKEMRERTFTRISLFFLLVFLSITPILVTWSNQIEFRYILGPSLAFFLVTTVLVLDLLKQNEKIRKFVFFPIILLPLIIGITSMNKNISNQFIDPYKSKNAFIQSQITECQKKSLSTKKIIILQPSTGFPSRNNIGIFSQSTDMASSWVPIPTVKYALKRHDLLPKEIVLQEYGDESVMDRCLIDLERFSQILAKDSGNPKS